MKRMEIDVLVAKSLELEYIVAGNGQVYYKTDLGGCELFAPTESWKSMGVLVEKAREQGIYLDPSHYPEGWRVDALKLDDDGIMSLIVTPLSVLINSLPLATSLSYLKARHIDVTPYINDLTQ
jgi:hypothetical protein